MGGGIQKQQPLQITDSQAKTVMGALSVFYRKGEEKKLNAISNILVYGQVPLLESGRKDLQHDTYVAALNTTKTELKSVAREANSVNKEFRFRNTTIAILAIGLPSAIVGAVGFFEPLAKAVGITLPLEVSIPMLIGGGILTLYSIITRDDIASNKQLKGAKASLRNFKNLLPELIDVRNILKPKEA